MSNIKQPETPFENDVLQELSEEDENLPSEANPSIRFSPANERMRPIKPHESKAVNSNVKYLSQIMKIDEYNIDDEEEGEYVRGINMPTTAMSKRPSMNKRNSQSRQSNDPLDFETVFLIGPSSDLDEQNQDQFQTNIFANQVEMKTPIILANYQNPDPSKGQDRSKS